MEITQGMKKIIVTGSYDSTSDYNSLREPVAVVLKPLLEKLGIDHEKVPN